MNEPTNIAIIQQSDGNWSFRIVDAFGRLVLENYDLPDVTLAFEQALQAFTSVQEEQTAGEAPQRKQQKQSKQSHRKKG